MMSDEPQQAGAEIAADSTDESRSEFFKMSEPPVNDATVTCWMDPDDEEKEDVICADLTTLQMKGDHGDDNY